MSYIIEDLWKSNFNFKPVDALIYSNISSWNKSGTGCYESIETISKKSFCNYKTAERSIKKLLDLGLIVKGDFNPKSKTYIYITTDKLTYISQTDSVKLSQSNCPISPKLTVTDSQTDQLPQSNCPNTTVKLTDYNNIYNKEYNKELKDIGIEPLVSDNKIFLILKDNTNFEVPADKIIEWQKVYSGINIIKELGKMKLWLESNTQKRKTETGMPRFINSWLSRADNPQPIKPNYNNSNVENTAKPIGNTEAVTEPEEEPKNYGWTDD